MQLITAIAPVAHDALLEILRELPRAPCRGDTDGMVRYSAAVGNARPYSCCVLLRDVLGCAMRRYHIKITPPRCGKGIRWTDDGRDPNGDA